MIGSGKHPLEVHMDAAIFLDDVKYPTGSKDRADTRDFASTMVSKALMEYEECWLTDDMASWNTVTLIFYIKTHYS